MSPYSSHSFVSSRLGLKLTGLAVAIGLHAGALAFLVSSTEPKQIGDLAPEEVIAVSLFDMNELADNETAPTIAETVVEETVVEESEPEPEPEPELEPEPEPEPEPVVEESVIPAPAPTPTPPKPQPKPVPKPTPEPKPTPQAQPKKEAKVAEVAQAAAAPKVSETNATAGGQTAKAVDPNKPRVVSQVNYQGAPPRPVYPRASQRRNEQGTAIVRVVITTQGTVGELWIKKTSGYERLDQAALDAVRKVKFKPYTENGVAYRAMADIPFDFVL